MRILIVSNLYPPDVVGGYELLTRDVADGLVRRGHQVSVLTSGSPQPGDPPRVHRTLELTRRFGEDARLERWRHARLAAKHRAATRAAVRAERPEAALVMSLRRLGLHTVRELDAALIPRVHCFNDDYLLAFRPGLAGSWVGRAVYGALDRGPLRSRTWAGLSFPECIYVSESLAQVHSSCGATLGPPQVCFQGVDRRMFPPRPPRAVPAQPKLLYVGRIHRTKGVDLAIRALAAVRERRPGSTLTIVGDGEPKLLRELHELARQLGVAEAVEFRGFVRREVLAAVYAEADVFLFPSTWAEPAGLTYLEAMSSGVPVVALARGGAGELLRHRENAVVADDAAGLAQGVIALVEEPALALRVVGGGETTVQREASLERYIDVIEARLRSSVGTGAAIADSRSISS